MGVKELGKSISLQRKKLNMTQNELAYNICTQPALSLIEKGNTKPTLENIFYFSLKLKTPIQDFLFFLIEEVDPKHIKKITISIDKLIEKQSYEKVLIIVNRELIILSKTNNITWYKHYLSWLKCLSEYQLHITDYQETIQICKALLDPKYSIINNINILSLKILNFIAFIHGENNNYQESLIYFNKALSLSDHQVKEYPSQSPHIYRIKIIYNKVKTLYDIGEYENTVTLIAMGIKESKEVENISLLGNFYYYLGQCYEKQNKSFQEISNNYKKSKYIFEFLDRQTYLTILYNLKKQYL